VMGWVLLSMTVVCILLATVLGNALDVPLHDGRALFLVVRAGIVGAGVPSVLLLVGIRAIGGTRAGIVMLIEPLVGVTLAAVLLHEALLPIQVAGGAAILAAALLLQRGVRGEGQDPVRVPVAERT
jgi:drug/metabolite transporter (DMT)-like permease